MSSLKHLPLHTPEALDLVNESCQNPRLILHSDLTSEQILRMAQSKGLGYVCSIEINCDHANDAIVQLLRTPTLTRVHTVITKQCQWGDYYSDCSPWGWEEDALSPALDELSKHSPFTRIEFRGAMPYYDSGEYSGAFGFIGISEWLKGIKHMVMDTSEVEDQLMQVVLSYEMLSKLDTLSISSPSITDTTANFIAITRKEKPFESLEVQGYLISNKGWTILRDSNNTPAHDRARFDARSKEGPKSWNDTFGNVRALLQQPLDETRFKLVVDQLIKLEEESDARYDAEIIPYLTTISRELWPSPVEIEFGSHRDMHYMGHVHILVPFLTFRVVTADPSWSNAQWTDLAHNNALTHVHEIESFNHGIALEDAQALLSSGDLENLRQLEVMDQHEMPPEGYVLLLSSPQLKNLEHLMLNLSSDTPGLPIAQAILSAPCLKSLKSLKFEAADEEQWEPLLSPLPCFES